MEVINESSREQTLMNMDDKNTKSTAANDKSTLPNSEDMIDKQQYSESEFHGNGDSGNGIKIKIHVCSVDGQSYYDFPVVYTIDNLQGPKGDIGDSYWTQSGSPIAGWHPFVGGQSNPLDSVIVNNSGLTVISSHDNQNDGYGIVFSTPSRNSSPGHISSNSNGLRVSGGLYSGSIQLNAGPSNNLGWDNTSIILNTPDLHINSTPKLNGFDRVQRIDAILVGTKSNVNDNSDYRILPLTLNTNSQGSGILHIVNDGTNFSL